MFSTFVQFVDIQLMRGLSSLLVIDVTLFVWDQCIISGFYTMLPLCISALLLGCEKEVIGLKSLKDVIETFISYCRNVTVLHLQQLLSKHCERDLLNIYANQGTYRLRKDNDNVLQVSTTTFLIIIISWTIVAGIVERDYSYPSGAIRKFKRCINH